MGRAIIVTGASTGIGLATALKYLEDEDDVVLVGRSMERLEKAIPKDFQGKGKAFLVAQDVSTLEGCKAVVEEGIKLLGGRLDVLVNNAGSGTFGLALKDITPEIWDFHMDINVRSVLYLTQLAAPLLEMSKGSIVNLSSIAAHRPIPGATAYSVSKAAVDMLTKATALELAPKGIRVNAINPATVKTNIFATAGLSPAQVEAYMANAEASIPIGRVGMPADVAELCYFLTDNAKAGWLTGQCILLDGGRLLPLSTAPRQ